MFKDDCNFEEHNNSLNCQVFIWVVKFSMCITEFVKYGFRLSLSVVIFISPFRLTSDVIII
jgi:hypothetical protein